MSKQKPASRESSSTQKDKESIAEILNFLNNENYSYLITQIEGKCMTFLEGVISDEKQRTAAKSMFRDSVLRYVRAERTTFEDVFANLFLKIKSKFSQTDTGSTNPHWVIERPILMSTSQELDKIVALID